MRVWEITDNIWLAFYLRFLIKWPLVRGSRGEGGRGASKQRRGDRGEAGQAHHTLLVNGIQEQCRSWDPPSAPLRVVVGSPGEM